MSGMRIFRLAIPASNHGASRAFYEDVLGIPADDTVPSRLYFHCGDMILALTDWSGDAQGEVHAIPDNLYLATSELEDVYQRAVAAGAHRALAVVLRPGPSGAQARRRPLAADHRPTQLAGSPRGRLGQR